MSLLYQKKKQQYEQSQTQNQSQNQSSDSGFWKQNDAAQTRATMTPEQRRQRLEEITGRRSPTTPMSPALMRRNREVVSLIGDYARSGRNSFNRAFSDGGNTHSQYNAQYSKLKSYLQKNGKDFSESELSALNKILDDTHALMNPKERKQTAWNQTKISDVSTKDLLSGKNRTPFSGNINNNAGARDFQTRNNAYMTGIGASLDNLSYADLVAQRRQYEEAEKNRVQSFNTAYAPDAVSATAKAQGVQTQEAERNYLNNSVIPGTTQADLDEYFRIDNRPQRIEWLTQHTNMTEDEVYDYLDRDWSTQTAQPQTSPLRSDDLYTSAINRLDKEIQKREFGMTYNPYTQEADFAENSGYRNWYNRTYPGQSIPEVGDTAATANNIGSNTYDVLFYESVNGNQQARDYITYVNSPDMGLGGEPTRERFRNDYESYMTSDEVQMFNYLYNTQGAQAAQKYFEELTPDLEVRYNSALDAEEKQMLANDPGLAIFANAVGTAVQPLTSLMTLGQMAYDTVTGREIDPNSSTYRGLGLTNRIRQQTGDLIIEAAGGQGTLGGDVAGFGWDLFNSIIDNKYGMAIGGAITKALGITDLAKANDTISKVTLGIMGTNSATSTTLQNLQLGMSQSEAIINGFTAGAIEVLTEKIGLDNLFDSMWQGKGSWVSWAKQVLAESGEEVLGNAMNDAFGLIYDRVTGTKISDWRRQMNDYILNNGLGAGQEAEAFSAVFNQKVKEAALAGLSGGLAAFPSGLYGTIRQSQNAHNAVEAAGITRNDTDKVKAAVDEGIAAGRGSESFKPAEQIQAKMADGKTDSVTDKDVRKLLTALYNDGLLTNSGRFARAENEFNINDFRSFSDDYASQYGGQTQTEQEGGFQMNQEVMEKQGGFQRDSDLMAQELAQADYDDGVQAAEEFYEGVQAQGAVTSAIETAIQNGMDPDEAKRTVNGFVETGEGVDTLRDYLPDEMTDQLNQIGQEEILPKGEVSKEMDGGWQSAEQTQPRAETRVEMEERASFAEEMGDTEGAARIRSNWQKAQLAEQLDEGNRPAETTETQESDNLTQESAENSQNRGLNSENSASSLQNSAEVDNNSARELSSSEPAQTSQNAQTEDLTTQAETPTATTETTQEGVNTEATQETAQEQPARKKTQAEIRNEGRNKVLRTAAQTVMQNTNQNPIQAMSAVNEVYTAAFVGSEVSEATARVVPQYTRQAIERIARADSKAYNADLSQRRTVTSAVTGVTYTGADGKAANIEDAPAVKNQKISKDTVRRLDQFAKALGVQINLVDTNSAFNGYYNNRTGAITLALDSEFLKDTTADRAVFATMGHEITHRLQSLAGDAYNNLRRAVANAMGSEAFNREVYRNINKGTPSIEMAMDEVVADFVGESFFNGTDFADRFFGEVTSTGTLTAEQHKAFQSLRDWVHKAIDWIKGNKNAFAKPEETIDYMQNVESALTRVLKEATVQAEKVDRAPQGKQNENTRFSTREVEKDSEGNLLTKAQQEYFSDSKVRDANGNLMVMHHGTDTASEFTVFRRGKFGYLGPGIYLTENRNTAKRYAQQYGGEGRIYEAYVNIINPYYVYSDTPAREILGDKVADRRAGKNTFATRWITTADINKLRDKGYDGIIWDYNHNGNNIEVSVFDSNQIKNITNENPTNNQDIRYSTRDTDDNARYMELAQDPVSNEPELQNIVDRTAKSAGYDSPLLYHGTRYFGFTSFDLDKLDDKMSIFVTPSYDTAESYSGKARYRRINERNSISEKSSAAEIAKEMNKNATLFWDDSFRVATEGEIKHAVGVRGNTLRTFSNDLKRISREYDGDSQAPYIERMAKSIREAADADNGDTVKEKLNEYYQAFKDMQKAGFLYTGIDRSVNQQTGGYNSIYERISEYADMVTDNMILISNNQPDLFFTKNQALQTLQKSLARGVYSLYGKTENLYEVDVEGSYWNEILGYYIDREMRNGESGDELYKTRDVARFAKQHGYDGVILRNIVDNGGATDFDGESDVYIYFNPSSLKSADPVTYDDDGNVIPLSERFVDENPDFRYSMRDADEQTDFRTVVEQHQQEVAIQNALADTSKWRQSVTRLDARKLNNETRGIVAEYGSTMSNEQRERIVSRVNRLANDIIQNKKMDYESIKNRATAIASDLVFQSVDADGRELMEASGEAERAVDSMTNLIMSNIVTTQSDQTSRAMRQVQEELRRNERLKETLRDVRAKRDQKIREDIERRKAQREKRADSKARTRLLEVMRRAEKLSKKAPSAVREEIQSYIKDFDLTCKELTDGKIAKLEELQRWVKERMEQDPLNFSPNPNVLKAIEGLTKDHINKLPQDEVFNITRALLNIEHELREGRHLADVEDRRDVQEIGKAIIQGVNDSRDKDIKHTKGIDGLYHEVVRPETFFRRMVGFDDTNPLYQITFGDSNQSLESGQLRMIDYNRRAHEKYFRPYLDDKDFQKTIIGKNARGIEIHGVDDHNQAVTLKITPDLAMAIYMHGRNDQNLKHFVDTENRVQVNGRWETVIQKAGGMTIPDFELYRQGKIEEAYRKGTKITMNRAEVRHLASLLNNKEMGYIHAAERYYSEMSQPEINRVSEILNGYSLATVDNYFRISTDPNYRKPEMDTVKFDATIEGQGWTKERMDASNPIVLYSLTDQLQRDIDGHSKYVGLAIPIRNFNKAMGVTRNAYNDKGELQTAYASSVQKAIDLKYGKNALKYIDKLMSDLQMPHSTQDYFGRLLSKVRSHYAGAVLTLNAGVAIKQAASYPTAAAEIGWAPLAKAMANTSLIRSNKLNMDLVYKYSPLMRLRTEGISTQELGEMKDQGRSIPKLLNWIQGMDVATVKKLWKASEYYVRSNYKNLQVGTDAYYRQVGEVHSKVIEKTQPNYSTLQRPQILRTNNELVKTLNMFKTQPFQNLNILMEAFGEMKATQRAAKNNPTAENQQRVSKARKRIAWAISSQVVSALVFSLMQFGWDFFRKKDDKYKNDEGKLEFESWAKQVAINSGSSVAGMVPFGSVIFEAMETATDKIAKAIDPDAEPIFDAVFYGIDAGTATDSINDSLKGIVNVLERSVEIARDLTDGDENFDWETYVRDTVRDAEEVMMFAGIPAENSEKLLSAMVEWGIDKGLYGEHVARYMVTRVRDGVKTSNKTSLIMNLIRARGTENYDMLYDMMINNPAFGTSSQTSQEYIDKKIEKWEKDQTANGMTFENQEAFDTVANELHKSGKWSSATEEEQEALNSIAEDYVLKSSQAWERGRSGVDSGVFTSTEYILFLRELQKADEANNENKSYDKDEQLAAIKAMGWTDAQAKKYWEYLPNDSKNPYEETKKTSTKSTKSTKNSAVNYGTVSYSKAQQLAKAQQEKKNQIKETYSSFESSWITSVDYDESKQALTFHTIYGTSTTKTGITKEEYQSFKNADSKGNWYKQRWGYYAH